MAAATAAAAAAYAEVYASWRAAERDLALTLDAFSTAVADAYDKRMPHLLAEHAYRIAQSFSKFYAACPVLAAPDAATRASRSRSCASRSSVSAPLAVSSSAR